MTLQITGENLAEAMDIRSGSQVLDVAAGNGNFTLSAARRWADVTSTDYVQSLLDRGKRRAEADGLDVTYQIADAENLPFEEGSFDAVGSTFGVMFSPNQRKYASEMLRVCKKGGKIGLANWTPEGFIGAVFKVIGQYVPPPAGLNSPALWGTRSHLEELFAEGTQKIEIETRDFDFRYRSIDHWMVIFRTYYGPVHKAFAAIDASKQELLAQDLTEVINRFNVADDGSLVIPSEYLEVVITRS